jgi:hypothetical protein
MYSAILSFLRAVIGNPHFIAVTVDLVSSVDITHLSFAQHNVKARDFVDRKFGLIDIRRTES